MAQRAHLSDGRRTGGWGARHHHAGAEETRGKGGQKVHLVYVRTGGWGASHHHAGAEETRGKGGQKVHFNY